jgi:hypothetical protein
VELTAPPFCLEIARRRWTDLQARFDAAPLRFEVKTAEGDVRGPVEFVRRADGFSVHDALGNHGQFCIASRSGTLSASQAAMESLLEIMVLTALDWTFFIGVHAACVMRDGRSVLLCGDSHAGKSTLVYACSRSGWTFVSDNSLHWASTPWEVLVSGSGALRLRDGARTMFGLQQNEFTPAERMPVAPAGPCVFLQRRAGPAAVLPFSIVQAMEYLAQYDTRPDRAYAEAAYRSLLRHGVWALEYEDVWDGVGMLETL